MGQYVVLIGAVLADTLPRVKEPDLYRTLAVDAPAGSRARTTFTKRDPPEETDVGMGDALRTTFTRTSDETADEDLSVVWSALRASSPLSSPAHHDVGLYGRLATRRIGPAGPGRTTITEGRETMDEPGASMPV